MSIAPVKCSVDVKASSARAFELFAQNMGAWWPRGKTPAARPHAALVVEPPLVRGLGFTACVDPGTGGKAGSSLLDG